MLLCYPVVFAGRDRRIWRVLNDTMTVVVPLRQELTRHCLENTAFVL
jgi:hypothetical protein